MTTNQLQYMQLQEGKRHNVEIEKIQQESNRIQSKANDWNIVAKFLI